MDIRQLRNFIRIVELGSLSRAARDVFVAQPALSQQIAGLEAELKTRLLIRTPRGVEPTEAGKKLYRAALSIAHQVERLRHEVAESGSDPAGAVSLGFPTSTAAALAVPLLREARARFPRVRLQITEGPSGLLRELVLQSRLDMAVLVSESISDNLVVRPLLVGDLFAVSAPGKAAASRRIASVRLAEIADEPFVLPTRSVGLRQRIDAACLAQGLSLRVVAEIDSLETVKAAAAAGLGCTILPWAALELGGRDARFRIRKLADAALSWDISLCTKDGNAAGAAVAAVLGLVPEVVAGLVKDKAWPGVRLAGALPAGHKLYA